MEFRRWACFTTGLKLPICAVGCNCNVSNHSVSEQQAQELDACGLVSTIWKPAETSER